jgi:hypothetical protein
MAAAPPVVEFFRYPEVVMSERAAFLARLARIAVMASPIGVAGWALQFAQLPS